MKILILSCHSDNNRELAGLTAPNKWKYSARHGYDLMTMRMGWEECKVGGLIKLRELLPIYDAIFAIGSDVVFTNMEIKIESLIQAGDGLVIAREHLEAEIPFPFNNDVSIWTNSTLSKLLLEEIIFFQYEWLEMKWFWQQWLKEKWDDRCLYQSIRLVEARDMNSCHQEGLGRWQPGDFIFHAMSYDEESKIKLCRYYLQAVKE